MENDRFDLFAALTATFGAQPSPGIREGGVYIQVGLGNGFYIPKADYDRAQALADETRKVQFVGLARDGSGLHGTREELLYNPNLAGFIAWIFPTGCNEVL